MSRRGEEGGIEGQTNLDPVQSTDSSPHSFFAVTSHAIREQARESGGVNVAAAQDWRSQSKVSEDGITAPEIITPIIRYKYPIDMPA